MLLQNLMFLPMVHGLMVYILQQKQSYLQIHLKLQADINVVMLSCLLLPMAHFLKIQHPLILMNHRIKNLPTQLYGQSAVAVTLSLIGKASFEMTSATAISFSTNPPINPPGGAGAYPSLAGTFFGTSSSTTKTAVVINLAATEFQLTQSDAINFESFDQVSIADATTPVNKATNDVTYLTGNIQSGGLSLPAFSVTRLY
jgi:hypothetical protein